MNEGLFGKYKAVLTKRQNALDEIITSIYTATSVLLTQEEIILEKKNISIQTSSVKKMILQKNNIQALLQEKGYRITM